MHILASRMLHAAAAAGALTAAAAAVGADSTEELIHREQPRSKRFRLPGDVQQRQLLQRDNGTYHVSR
jgi:LPS O-antigen subunit length determinant protein (WzzB/FepE family)